MIRHFLLLVGLAFGATAFANTPQRVEKTRLVDQMEAMVPSFKDIPSMKVDLKPRTFNGTPRSKAPGVRADAPEIHWKRPAGQFWGTGYSPETNRWYNFTPLSIRPWTEYTFENISTGVSGTPHWDIEVLTDPQTGAYETMTSDEMNVSASYLLYEACAAPRLSYGNSVPFPSMYYGFTLLDAQQGDLKIAAAENIKEVFGASMPVSSHYFSVFSLDGKYEQGISLINGLGVYEGMDPDDGMAFGTNSWGYNACATRFEKPEMPYLLNNVQWFYISSGEIPNDIPLKAYVFKTVDPAAIYTMNDGSEMEGAELGELIAYSESYIPASQSAVESVVQFDFKEKNPVTGALSDISLEIEDDIIIMVTGYDVDLGNGQYVTSLMSVNEIDEGYGNLGYIGYVDESENSLDGYTLLAFKDMLGINSVSGILADVSYPWLLPYDMEQENIVHLPNDGETTETEQGLEYVLYLVSTLDTSEYEVTFNGEDESDWLEIVDAYDEYDDDGNGEEVFAGFTAIAFEAAPNPEDVDRTCVVKISIPAASYEITFLQGSKNTAVEIVGIEGCAQYFDLQGRQVANPEKGIYIKKNGNKTSKVIL